MLKMRRLVCCLGWAVVIFLTDTCRAGHVKELQTGGNPKLRLINELGAQVGGKDHLLFDIKGKGQAHLILSETEMIDPKKGKYYVIALAMKYRDLEYRMNGIKYGCIRCSTFSATGVKTSIVADKFTQLWISWKDGHIKVGDGTDIHERPFMDYKGPQTYDVNFINVFTLKYPGQWRFRIDNPPLFTAPLPSGSTAITVPENSPVNKVVFAIVCEDPENDTIRLTLKNHQDFFHVDKSTVVLKHTLDYEKQRQYSLMIEAFDGIHRVPVAMSVKVVDVNDEAPVVVVSDDLSIPEELSVGTVLGGLFEATDADHNDKLTFTLQGGHNYFTINETSGKLTLKRRINFDGVYGVKKIDKMTLTVTDNGNNQVKVSLTIAVTDINDNTPSFGDIVYRFNVTENGSHRMELANFVITDADSGRNGQFYMDLASTTYLDIFTVQGTSLMVEASKIDYEQLQNQDFAYTLTVRATDRSDTGATNVGKATVLVEVLPVNEYYPKWTSQKLRGNSVRFEDKTILRHDPVGTIVETFQAEDDDKGKDGAVTYIIISVKSDKGEDVHNHFFMDKYSGQLKTAFYFDVKNESSFYDIVVQAIDGGNSPKSVHGQLKVNLGFGGTGLAGAGGAARMGGGMTESVKLAAGIRGAGMGVGGGAGMGGGIRGSVRLGADAAGKGGAGVGVGGGAGAAFGTGGQMTGSVRPGAGAAGIGGAGMGVRGGAGAGAAVGMGVGTAGSVRPGAGAPGIGGAGMGVGNGARAGAAVGMGVGTAGSMRPAAGMGVSNGAGAGAAVGMGVGTAGSVRPGSAGGVGIAGTGVGDGTREGGRAGMRGGLIDALGSGLGGAAGMGGYVRAGVIGTGHAGVSGSSGRDIHESRVGHGGIDGIGTDGVSGTGGGKSKADGDGRADVSGTDSAGRFSGRGGIGGTVDTQGTRPSRGGGDGTDSCDDGSSGCARGKDHRDGSGRSVSVCSTVLSHRNTEIWVMRGGYGLLLFLGAFGLLMAVCKNKKTRMLVTPVSSVTGIGPQGSPGLGEFQSSAPMDTHK